MAVEKAPPDYPAGTGWRAGVPGLDVLGKTASAQITNRHRGKSDAETPYKYRDHAWFIAGAMDGSTKIAICILVEHGVHGSTAASLLAKPLIEFLYQAELPEVPAGRVVNTKPGQS